MRENNDVENKLKNDLTKVLVIYVFDVDYFKLELKELGVDFNKENLFNLIYQNYVTEVFYSNLQEFLMSYYDLNNDEDIIEGLSNCGIYEFYLILYDWLYEYRIQELDNDY
jgi:hypothetical protein